MPDESKEDAEQERPSSSGTSQQSNSDISSTSHIPNESAPIASNDSTTSTTSWRQTVGRRMGHLSNTINENIVVARYGIVASVTLLSAYGIAHTPLLYRFRSVKDIPSVYFTSRRKIHCRLVRVLDDNKSGAELGDAERPVVCLVRHMSPLGRLLPRSLFDSLIQSSPSGSGRKLGENMNELLKVELAGIRQAPFYRSLAEQPGEWLQRLADQHARVSCELISRCAAKESTTSGNPAKRQTRTLKECQPISEDQTAVCRIRYRPGKSLLRVDLGESLVRYGRVSISSAGMHVPDESTLVVDTSDSLKDLEKDTKYMQKLEQAEYLAAKESHGMWDDPQVRSDRKDIVEEIEFEAKATVLQKLWRWLRGA